MKRMLGLSLVCVLLGVGLAAAQQPSTTNDQREGCDHHRGGGPGRGHGKMLKKMDTNNDGRITREEFNAQHEEHFKRMDKNNDGVVTEDEIRQMHDEHGHGHGGPRGHAAPNDHQHAGPRGGAGSGG